MNKIKMFFQTLRFCGIRWWAMSLPAWFFVGFEMQFNSSICQFNGKNCHAIRVGNSGLFLVYSEEIQKKIIENIKKHREADEEYRRNKIREEYEKEFL